MNTTTPGARQKALALNLGAKTYGTFAEIGGGQEVARCTSPSAAPRAPSPRQFQHTTWPSATDCTARPSATSAGSASNPCSNWSSRSSSSNFSRACNGNEPRRNRNRATASRTGPRQSCLHCPSIGRESRTRQVPTPGTVSLSPLIGQDRTFSYF